MGLWGQIIFTPAWSKGAVLQGVMVELFPVQYLEHLVSSPLSHLKCIQMLCRWELWKCL